MEGCNIRREDAAGRTDCGLLVARHLRRKLRTHTDAEDISLIIYEHENITECQLIVCI